MREVWLYNRYLKVDISERVENTSHKIESVLFLSGLTVFKQEKQYYLKSPTWADELRKSPNKEGKERHTEEQGIMGSAGECRAETCEAT